VSPQTRRWHVLRRDDVELVEWSERRPSGSVHRSVGDEQGG
jgi:hypothetical protein